MTLCRCIVQTLVLNHGIYSSEKRCIIVKVIRHFRKVIGGVRAPPNPEGYPGNSLTAPMSISMNPVMDFL